MAYFSTTDKLFWNTKQKMDESIPEVIEFLLLHKKCQTWALVFVYQGCHIQIRMDCAKNYGYESLMFLLHYQCICIYVLIYKQTHTHTHTHCVGRYKYCI